MRTVETLSTLNSIARTVLAFAVLGGLGAGGYFVYSMYNGEKLELESTKDDLKQTKKELAARQGELDQAQAAIRQRDQEIGVQKEEIQNLSADVAAKAKEIERLSTSLRLLKLDHRLAKLTVVDQTTDPQGKLMTKIEFVELNDEGASISSPKKFELEGDMVYVDYWVVKFEDRFIEEAAIDRSTSICLFRRIFSEARKPEDGFVIDEPGSQPGSYARGGKPSEFEQQIWSRFWSIANDEAQAKSFGIRAAHGEAVSIKAQKGKSYRLQLRASDGLSITVDSGNSPPAG